MRARLKHACLGPGQYGANLSADEYVAEGARFLRTTDIRDDGTLTPKEDGVFVPEHLVRDYLLEPGHVLFSRSGTIGLGYLHLDTDAPHAYAGYLVRFRPREDADSRYLTYSVRSRESQAEIEKGAVVSTIANFNAGKYGNLAIWLPALPTQRAIADFLDRKTAAIDALIEKKQKLLDLLAEKRTALINRAVTKGLDPSVPMKDSGVPWIGEIPAHWEVRRVGHLFFLGRGRVMSRDYIEEHRGPYPVYSSQTANDGVFGSINTFEFEGDFLTWTTDGANAGTVFRRKGRFSCTNVCGTLKARGDALDLDFVHEALDFQTTRFVRLDINPKLMNQEMDAIRVPLPPFAEQQRLAAFIRRTRATLDQARPAIAEQVSRLAEYRQALITAAVTGKIDVEEA